MTQPEKTWWKDGVVYQIYPASFKDSNSDGLGDIPGIISKVDYLADLGVDIVWVSPMFESPQVDMGYDISNYEAVHAPYGTVQDMEELIAACHARGMRLILDLVINHTSDQHACYFSGSAWTWDESFGEYYLHLFAPEQPDLSWENPEAREAIYDSAMRFWLDRGVDGFRVDCVNMYSKGTELPDAPVVDAGVFEQPSWSIHANGPRMHEFLREMNEMVLSRYDTMTVGELPHTPDADHVLRYVSAGDRQMDMVFQFDFTFIAGTDAWTTAFCENHDQGRSVSRYGSDDPAYRALSAKMLAIMMCALTGTLFVYQGQEIGMINIPPEWAIEADYKDIEALNFYRSVQQDPNCAAEALEYARRSIRILGRDNARTAMQWDASAPFAGFTDCPDGPWMRVHDLYPGINIAAQRADPGSVLAFWKRMIALRKEHRDVFVHGAFELLGAEDENTFVFVKTYEGKRALVVLNFTGEEQRVELPEGRFELLVGNYGGDGGDSSVLRPWEGRVYMEER
ncbi:Uu.00g082470.m01.CDS01 [Anthostomella pinea]|uniref:Uu.00g082470.m01.CDS01 n=1 Tax=Anthostomella pinea TaxID=933095 RepID=A0AAI8VMA9_9PEZI|nr:Uu.00g082470.m01.CDS01 [Anthostomella pinea]